MNFRSSSSLGFGAVLLFCTAAWLRGEPPPVGADQAPYVVVPAPMQVVLYAGDRFLAASVESVRAAASGQALEGRDNGYRLRAHRVVSQLNPCHEDNYWIGNAALSWGGAADDGFELLGRAAQCRFWDELPPFLYGFNQQFFRRDIKLARQAMELAAERSTENAAGFRNIAIMLTVNATKDTHVALAMLQHERDGARDPALRDMLDKRVERIAGLVSLRDAQKNYEDRFGSCLQSPDQLLQTGLLTAFPNDPLGLGYEFRDGEFFLKKIKVLGLD